MIPVKQAVTAAEAYVRGLYDPSQIQFLRLEAVELSDDRKHWKVTLSFVEQATSRSSPIVGPLNYSVEKLPRVYKYVTVDAESGEALGMKMRPS